MLDASGSIQQAIQGDAEAQQGAVAFEMLRADIVSCRIAPGANVSEAELAARYGLGKAAIRRALIRLSERGWVRALSRRGYAVKPIALRDIGEIFSLRRMLEPVATRHAAGRADTRSRRRPPRRRGVPLGRGWRLGLATGGLGRRGLGRSLTRLELRGDGLVLLLLALLREDRHRGQHRHEQADADQREQDDVPSGEVRVAPREHKRREKRERDEDERDREDSGLLTPGEREDGHGCGTYRIAPDDSRGAR